MKFSYLNIVFVLFWGCLVVHSQVENRKKPWLPKKEAATISCEDNLALLDTLIQSIHTDKMLLIVSHLGKRENRADLSRRRLYNIKTYYTKGFDQTEREAESIVIADGEKVTGKGYLDFYVEGQIILRLYLNYNRDLTFGPCTLLPEEKRCSTAYEKMFYPCRKL
jgi:hypothetical protein